MAPAPRPPKDAIDILRRFALTYPGAHEDHPWGETVVKVAKKVFVFLGKGEGQVSLSVKLPRSATLALSLPFATPTGYGLGKSGWVTATFPLRKKPPVDVLRQWIDESYRAVAPKRLVAELDAKAGEETKPASKKKAAQRRTAS